MPAIDVAAELGRLAVEFQITGPDEYRIRCPFHDDVHPSCDVSSKGFICRACHVSGDIVSLVARLSGKPRHVILASLDAEAARPIEVAVIQRHHKRLWSALGLLAELRKRGISDATIKRYLLGENEGRVVIPIQNADGIFVNLRRYLPGAKDVAKMLNLRGRSIPRLYPFEQLQFNKIVLCGGEIKALAAAQILNQHDIGAITITCGEGEWSPKFVEYFKGKHVWVCQDIDTVGRKSAEYRCAQLANATKWVGNVLLPLDINEFPTGDLNDFIVAGGDLFTLLTSTEKWSPAFYKPDGDGACEPLSITIRQAMGADMVLKRFTSEVSVSAQDQNAYFIPKSVRPVCDRTQDNCQLCPVFASKPGVEFQVPTESTAILAMMDVDTDRLDSEIQTALKIPTCPSVTFEVVTNYKVLETRIQRAINLTQQDSDKIAIPAVIVDQKTELNETYSVTGRAVPHPKTQRSFVIISKAEAIADALTDFVLVNPQDLKRFQPIEWTLEGLDELLDPLYNELSVNITHIYKRPALHQLIDLTYHSVLNIRVGEQDQKGWVESLIVGDNSQGKSLTAWNMAQFYGLGERVDCKNATVAGLLGGAEQFSGKWFIQWGVIPNNDRRLVILEELKGMHPEVFSKLTDMRSSGIAEVPKIIRQKTNARTRLIVISNARKGNLDNYSYGVSAVSDLISNPEDVRRFDVCMVVNKNEVDAEVIHKFEPQIPSTFTPDMCRRLVLWCWTRNVEQVRILPETLEYTLKESKKLSSIYTDDIPLLEKGGTRLKLLRLATALAGRTFSTDDDFQQLIVRPCHIAWVSRFLQTEYNKPSHGYGEISNRAKRQEVLINLPALKTSLATMPNARDTIEHLLFTDEIEVRDFCHWCNWSTEESMLLLSSLVRANALVRHGSLYRKRPAFTEMLRDLMTEPLQAIPEHIQNDY